MKPTASEHGLVAFLNRRIEAAKEQTKAQQVAMVGHETRSRSERLLAARLFLSEDQDTPRSLDFDRLFAEGEEQVKAQLGAALAGYATKWYWDGSKLVARIPPEDLYAPVRR